MLSKHTLGSKLNLHRTQTLNKLSQLDRNAIKFERQKSSLRPSSVTTMYSDWDYLRLINRFPHTLPTVTQPYSRLKKNMPRVLQEETIKPNPSPNPNRSPILQFQPNLKPHPSPSVSGQRVKGKAPYNSAGWPREPVEMLCERPQCARSRRCSRPDDHSLIWGNWRRKEWGEKRERNKQLSKPKSLHR